MAKGRPLSFSLRAENWPQSKEQSETALPCLRPRVGAPVALQQSRTLRTSAWSLPCQPVPLFQRGHLYFAEKGTFLLCVDTLFAACILKKQNFNNPNKGNMEVNQGTLLLGRD